MKYSRWILQAWILTISMVLTSCVYDDIDIDLTANPWKVVKMRESGELNYTQTDSTYILRFLNNVEYTLSLDVNSCMGQYEIPNKGEIEIQAMACTEACCDTEFAKDLSLLVSKMNRYYGRGDELHFEGRGKIVLQRH